MTDHTTIAAGEAAGREECRECRAGLKQATNASVGYYCPVHGVQEYNSSDRIAALEAENTRLEERVRMAVVAERDWDEREAAVCPEDVGFEEYIRTLEQQNTRLAAERDAAIREVGEWSRRAGRVEEERDRLRRVVERVPQVVYGPRTGVLNPKVTVCPACAGTDGCKPDCLWQMAQAALEAEP